MVRRLPYFISVPVAYSHCLAVFPPRLVPRFGRALHSRLRVPTCVPTVLLPSSAGISTCCPSLTPPRPQLRSRLPQGRSALPWKPWIFGHMDSHHILATHSGILSSIQSTAPSGTASSRMQCSSTNVLHTFLSFGDAFQPRTFSARDLSTSELLRTL